MPPVGVSTRGGRPLRCCGRTRKAFARYSVAMAPVPPERPSRLVADQFTSPAARSCVRAHLQHERGVALCLGAKDRIQPLCALLQLIAPDAWRADQGPERLIIDLAGGWEGSVGRPPAMRRERHIQAVPSSFQAIRNGQSANTGTTKRRRALCREHAPRGRDEGELRLADSVTDADRQRGCLVQRWQAAHVRRGRNVAHHDVAGPQRRRSVSLRCSSRSNGHRVRRPRGGRWHSGLGHRRLSRGLHPQRARALRRGRAARAAFGSHGVSPRGWKIAWASG